MTDQTQPERTLDHNVVPTVSRVIGDTIIELVYDAERRSTALVVSRFGGLWNIESELKVGTEMLVPYSPRNNLIANQCVLLPSMPIECGRKQDLLADITHYLHRYVDLSPLFEQIAAHYVLLSWVYDAFNELPYLRLRGEFGTGKTRALLAIGSLCYRGFFASGASTVSPIFHTLNSFGGTLILDEADLPYSDARVDLVKIFNNGTVKGVPVLRTVVNRNKEFNPQAFKVFGPKIIAMRGCFADRALESRFLTEETGTRPLRADIPIQLPDSLKSDALTLRNRLLHYRLCHLFDVKSDPTALIAGGGARLNQTALSLLSLVDDPDLRTQIKSVLKEQDELIRRERMEQTDMRVLTAVMGALGSTRGDISLKAITERFNASEEGGSSRSNRWIGHILRQQLRIATARIRGSYFVPDSERAKITALAERHDIRS